MSENRLKMNDSKRGGSPQLQKCQHDSNGHQPAQHNKITMCQISGCLAR